MRPSSARRNDVGNRIALSINNRNNSALCINMVPRAGLGPFFKAPAYFKTKYLKSQAQYSTQSLQNPVVRFAPQRKLNQSPRNGARRISCRRLLTTSQLKNTSRGRFMARIRSIKPEFFEDTKLSKAPIQARYLYIGLWCWADRQGVFDWDAQLIKKNIFPYDDVRLKDVDSYLESLLNLEIIKTACYEDKQFGFIPKFLTHQNPHHREFVKYKIPLTIFESPVSALGQPGTSREDLGFKDLGIKGLRVSGITSTVPERSGPMASPEKLNLFSPKEILEAIPAENKSRWFALYEQDADFIQRELIKAIGYYFDNPKKKPKSARGWLTALSSWLERGWSYRAKGIKGEKSEDMHREEIAKAIFGGGDVINQ
jgi:hypothetical protein